MESAEFINLMLQSPETVKRISEFLAKLTGGPVGQLSGILNDYIRYFRWTRLDALANRVNQLMIERGSPERYRAIPLNVLLPILEAGSLEEDVELQELWARLLANAADPQSDIEVKRRYVSILQDFTYMEVRLLQAIHDAPPIQGGVPTKGLPDDYTQPGEEPEEGEEDHGLPRTPVQTGLWNLKRLGCIESAGTWDSFVGIRRVQITSLGRSLMQACSNPPK